MPTADAVPIVLMGAGMWAARYAEALWPYQANGKASVVVVYDSSFGRESPEYVARIEENILRFSRDYGMEVLDLSNDRDRVAVGMQTPRDVFVVTHDEGHYDAVKRWLGIAMNIIVEKPFDVDETRAASLIDEIDNVHTNVYAFDHYLVRASGLACFPQHNASLAAYLQDKLGVFRFRMLEGHDPNFVARAPSLQQGMILDMGAHAAALVYLFGDPASIVLKDVHAGVFDEEPQSRRRGADLIRSGRETFASIDFSFTSCFGTQVAAIVEVGKFVGTRDEKTLIIASNDSPDSAAICIDYTSGNIAHTTLGEASDWDASNVERTADLIEDAIVALVDQVMSGHYEEGLSLFRAETAYHVVHTLNAWREQVLDRIRYGTLPTYTALAPLEVIRGELGVA